MSDIVEGFGIRELRAPVPVSTACLAIIAVGADKHPPATIINHDLVEIGPGSAAQRARF